MTRILLFGAGAIGSVYVYTLIQAGASVTAVCRSNYDAVKKDGITIYSMRFGNVHCRPGVVRTVAEAAATSFSSSPHDAPVSRRWDFVVVCAKCFPGSAPSLSEMIRPAVGPGTAIVLIQNGIDIEADLAAHYPDHPILSCTVYLPATQIRPGVIDYGASLHEDLNVLEIGTYPAVSASTPESHQRAAVAFAALVQSGGGNAQVYDDVQPRRWAKLIVNAAWNPIAALSLSSDADFLSSSPGAIDLVRGVMLEVVAVAQALPVPVPGIDEALVETQLARSRGRTVGKEPSMLVDVRMGRPFEIEAIVGNTVRLAHKHQVKVPLLEALYALAKGLFEAGTRARRSSVGPGSPDLLAKSIDR